MANGYKIWNHRCRRFLRLAVGYTDVDAKRLAVGYTDEIGLESWFR
jgi:hypothetical protein